METTAGDETVPRELAAVQALVNTVDREAGDDQLDSPEALRRFLTGHGLLAASEPVGPDDLAMAVELREALRAMLRVNHGEALDPAALEVDGVDQRLDRRQLLRDGLVCHGLHLTFLLNTPGCNTGDLILAVAIK